MPFRTRRTRDLYWGIDPATPATNCEEHTMAKIVITDLTENTDLDREAMQAISGGARLRGSAPTRPVPRGDRIGGHADRVCEARLKASPRRPAPSMLFK